MKGVNLDFVAQAIGIKVFLHGFGEFDYARLGHAVTRQVGHRDCACAGCHIDQYYGLKKNADTGKNVLRQD
jgi:hypothetical protein